MTNSRGRLIAAGVLALSCGLGKAQTQYLISTYAGGLPGPTAATATTYAFRTATGVATDQFGNTYIGTASHCVFRLDANGNLSRVAGTCQAGFSGDGGAALNAQLNNPQGVALDAAGNLYIADQGNQRIRKVTPAGTITTVAGTGVVGYSGDNGPATSAALNSPQGVAVDSAGNLYIADPHNHRIRQVAPNGTISTVAGTGDPGNSGDGGPATAATFSQPVAVAVSPAGNLYIADAGSNQVRKIVPGGTVILVAGNGTGGSSGDSGPASAAELSDPQGVAVDWAGNVYIADQSNSRVRKVDVNGVISTYAGGGPSFGDNGPATSAQLSQPVGVAVDYSGDLYIADVASRIRMVNPGGTISTVAGTGFLPSSGDGGAAGLAQLTGPWGLARDGSGNLYVADWKANRVREISPAGTISTFAGTGLSGDSGDGGPATSAAVTPYVVAVDSLGNVYLADTAVIRKIDTKGKISTIAGTGAFGYSGDNGTATAAKLNYYLPGLAVDANQNVYVSDFNNQRVRMVAAATGIITTVAGTGTPGFNGDDQAATTAQLSYPTGLAVDGAGNLYIADYNNNRIRKVSALTGNISTVAGNGSSQNTGDGEPATSAGLEFPWAVTVDGFGNLYISTSGNTVRKVTPGGIISTIAGTGVLGYAGDGGLAASAELNYPLGLASDSAGNIYVSDFSNAAVRVLQPETEPVLTVSSTHSGTFVAGEQATFSINVGNSQQAASTSGTVTVTDTLPPSLTPVAMGGTGWNCSYSSAPYFCTNTGPLEGGASYSTITLMVNVASGAQPQITNLATVSGGGSLGASCDDAAFAGPQSPVLEIAATHIGNFSYGGEGIYTIKVGNQASSPPTSGTVTVTDTLPLNFSLVSMTGTNWTCNGTTCSRADTLAPGATYDAITVTVSVGASAAPSVINQASVSGGGAPQPASASDPTSIVTAACSLTGDSLPTVADVQKAINEALGVNPPAHDLNQDGVVNIVDVQIVINAALGRGCSL